jgi:formylglycine-generating enzyme required for sulfatase activity
VGAEKPGPLVGESKQGDDGAWWRDWTWWRKETWWRSWPLLASAGAVFGLLLLGIIIVIKYRGADGKTRELSVEVRSTDEKTKRLSEQGSKPAENLPVRYKSKLGMEFVLVPKGKFFSGGGGGRMGEKEVEIPYDFYLGVHEVTQREWQAVTGINPSWFARTGSGKDEVKEIPNDELKQFPVESVSWTDAQVFLEAVNAQEKEAGWVYRLSKDAEWEYACRGGPRDNKFEYSNDFYLEKPSNDLLPGQANFVPERGKGLQRTCKVGAYHPNSLGLHDMHGNVWEWCDDEECTKEGASRHVIRGGCWHDPASGCWAGSRLVAPVSHRLNNLGLRLARVSVGSTGK